MNNTTAWENGFSSPQFCKEDEFLKHLMGRGLLYLLRGAAATLLMPIEILEHLRRGRSVGWRTRLSWALSATVYTSFYLLSKGSLPGGRVTLLLCILGTFLAVVFNGKLQASQEPRRHGFEAWGHGWYHHHHSHWHHWRYHHDASRRSAVGGRGERASALVQPTTSKEGVCCGNCRECKEEICLKTGLAKREATE